MKQVHAWRYRSRYFNLDLSVKPEALFKVSELAPGHHMTRDFYVHRG